MNHPGKSTDCPTPTKRGYSTQREARGQWHALMRHGASKDLTVYQCRCGNWHVGHSWFALRRRIRAARKVGQA
jgi:hypothetical protein